MIVRRLQDVVDDMEPATIYALDQHEEYILKAEEELQLVRVFNPPVVGREVHDETGADPAIPVDRAES